jgi:copper oxidase (laccase) domain-containing protein
MADRRTGVVSAVHAGWRGTAQQVVRAAIDAMRREFGTAPADLVVAIGPSIRACCYEVGPELRTAFSDAGHDVAAIDRWFLRGKGDRWQLDVIRANRDQLEAAGVPSTQIHDSGLCTMCQKAASSPDLNRASNAPPTGRARGETGGETIALHSYRRSRGAAGRMLAAIRARGEKHKT